jgi:NADPH-dependent 2,4-dienoyl-CoA reductase/sulfur reductase-like enzyme
MSNRLVVVGGNPGGMAAVSQARKGIPDLDVVALEMGGWTSYAACGIPFVVGGLIPGIDRLVARSADQHRRTGTDVRLHHEVMTLDLAEREVEVRDHTTSATYRLGFDQLLIATGGRPVRPPLPGIELPFVVGVQTLDDASVLLEHAEREGCRRIVVVGAGYIGLEMAEAFCHRGCTSIVVDQASQPMVTLDPELGAIVADALDRHGIDFRPGVKVLGFEPGTVLTDQGAIEADLVVLGIGTLPRADLGAAAGLETGVKGAIVVDDRQRTSVAGVWAAGDCATSTHLVTGEQVHMALGTYANRTARVAGINIGGGDARSPGVLGTAVTRLCDLEIGRTGLSTFEAERAGLDATSSTIEATTRAGYYPGAEPLTVRLISEQGSGRVLGGQIVGGTGAAKRIDVIATAVTAGMTIDDVLDLDLAYAPPFGGVWDPISVAARSAISARSSSADASR